MIFISFKRKDGFSPKVYQDRQGAWWALIAIWCLLYFTATIVALHILRPGLNPLRRVVSNYAVGPFGFFMVSAFLMLALCEFALAQGFARLLTTSTAASASVLLLKLAGVGMVVTAIFPGDATSFHAPDTATLLIHWTGVSLSFLFLMIATFLLLKSFKADAQWQAFHRPARILTVAMVLTLIVFGLLTIGGWIGAGERIYLVACLLWLFLTSARLRAVATGKIQGSAVSERVGK